jgi:hypothetical protein
MKLKDFKEMIISLPEEFDEYDVIYSEIQDENEESYTRIDDLLVGMITDDEENKMCLMGEDSYKIVLELYGNGELKDELEDEDLEEPK